LGDRKGLMLSACTYEDSNNVFGVSVCGLLTNGPHLGERSVLKALLAHQESQLPLKQCSKCPSTTLWSVLKGNEEAGRCQLAPNEKPSTLLESSLSTVIPVMTITYQTVVNLRSSSIYVYFFLIFNIQLLRI